jgi:hypothetical protein
MLSVWIKAGVDTPLASSSTTEQLASELELWNINAAAQRLLNQGKS